MPKYLAALSQQYFDAIPAKAVPRTASADESPHAIEIVIGAYRAALIYDNEKLKTCFEKEGTEWRSELTQGQRMLHALGAFDDQVQNGGVTQFFWNCPDLVFEVSDGLKVLGPAELKEIYDRALEGLVGKKDDWAKLRKQAFRDPANPNWEPFQRSYDMLDLGWFDDAYFNQLGSNDQGEYVLENPGLGATMLKRLADYVKSHREEFIES